MSNVCAIPDVSVLIVGYNSLRHLDDAIASIAPAAGGLSHEVLFVNNGTDGSEDHVRRHYPQVRVLQSRGNVGFAAGNNYLASAASGRWLLLLNPDTRLEANAIRMLVEAGDTDPRFKALGGTSLDRTGQPLGVSQLLLPSLGRLVRTLIGTAKNSKTVLPSGQIVPAEAVSGGFMLVDRAAWEQLGGLDERFFLYAEELDMCARLHQTGALVGVVPHARMFHDIGSGNAQSPQRLMLSLRGIATYYRKHFSRPYALACIVVHWLDCVKRFVAGSLMSSHGSHWRAMAESMKEPSINPWRWMGGY